MSTFDPVTLFFILHETMGAWLWMLLGAALVLLAGIVSAFVRLRRARCPVSRPIWMAVAAGLIAAAGLTFAVPIWSLADPGALNGSVDYAVAFLIALIPGAIVGALVFMLVARRSSMTAPHFAEPTRQAGIAPDVRHSENRVS